MGRGTHRGFITYEELGKSLGKRGGSVENTEKAASGDTNAAVGSMSELTIKTNLADLPFVGSYLDGATLTTGFAEHDHSTVANVDDAFDVTAAINYSTGPFSFGVQKKIHNEGESATDATVDAVFYKDTIILFTPIFPSSF